MAPEVVPVTFTQVLSLILLAVAQTAYASHKLHTYVESQLQRDLEK